MKYIQLLLLVLFYSVTSTANPGDNYHVDEHVLQMKIEFNPDDMDAREELAVVYKKDEMYRTANLTAKKGYLLTDEEYYKYSFFDKMFRNKLDSSLYIGSNQIYNRKGIFAQTTHNYDKGNWLYLSYQHEVRTYLGGGTTPSTQITLGHILTINEHLYLESSISTSPERQFFPEFTFSNEIFLNVGKDTYSLMGKILDYDGDTIFLVSPSFQRAEEDFYFGGRAYFTFEPYDVLPAARIYIGHSFDYKTSMEFGMAGGKEREDGYVNTTFRSFDIFLRSKITHDKELGFKIIHYQSTILNNDNTALINFTWKY